MYYIIDCVKRKGEKRDPVKEEMQTRTVSSGVLTLEGSRYLKVSTIP